MSWREHLGPGMVLNRRTPFFFVDYESKFQFIAVYLNHGCVTWGLSQHPGTSFCRNERTNRVVQAILREQGVVEMLAKSVHKLRCDDAEVMTDEFVQLGRGLSDSMRALYGCACSRYILN